MPIFSGWREEAARMTAEHKYCNLYEGWDLCVVALPRREAHEWGEREAVLTYCYFSLLLISYLIIPFHSLFLLIHSIPFIPIPYYLLYFSLLFPLPYPYPNTVLPIPSSFIPILSISSFLPLYISFLLILLFLLSPSPYIPFIPLFLSISSLHTFQVPNPCF